jgi:hypothetical protein
MPIAAATRSFSSEGNLLMGKGLSCGARNYWANLPRMAASPDPGRAADEPEAAAGVADASTARAGRCSDAPVPGWRNKSRSPGSAWRKCIGGVWFKWRQPGQ